MSTSQDLLGQLEQALLVFYSPTTNQIEKKSASDFLDNFLNGEDSFHLWFDIMKLLMDEI